MKYILKILPIITYLLLPTYSNADDCLSFDQQGCNNNHDVCKWENNTCIAKCPTDTTNNTCEHWDGCYYDEYGCAPCPVLTYNPGGSSQTCERCATYDSNTNTYNTDFLNGDYPTNHYGMIFDPAYTNTTGMSSCPWICEADYYKSNNSCQQCPSNSTTESYSNGGATSITDCKCASHYYMGGSGNNECISCPEHSSCHTNGTNNSTGLTFNNVTCDTGYTLFINNNNQITCSIGCGLYAVPNSSNNGCICNVGYYGDGTTCSACPIGTTSSPGSQNISDCKMTSATLFCDGTGENCMQLIPNGTTISAH